MGTNEGITITDIRVERSVAPWGIDVSPRISWKVESEVTDVSVLAVTVVVHSHGERVWQTTVERPALFEVECPRNALRADTAYDIAVTVTSDHGEAEATSRFRTGFFSDADWAGAEWIAAPPALRGPAPLFRAEFTVPEGAASARLYLAAGGFVRVLVNGRAASDEVLGPGITAYDKRVQYLVWDVADAVAPGTNALTIEVGRGFFAMAEPNIWQWETSPWSGAPRIRLALMIDDSAALVSGAHFSSTSGPTLYDDLYGGETFDARFDLPGASLAGFDDSTWSPSVVIEAPAGVLVHRRQQPIRVTGTLTGTIVSRGDGTAVIDFGRVIAGWVRIDVAGPAGTTIDVRYGEKLADGHPNDGDPLDYYNGRFQRDTFILRGGDREIWESRFGWKGFRFVEVSGWPGETVRPEQVVARVAHTDVERTGGFDVADSTMQSVHALVVPTILNNLHSIPTDTPKYEKNGWTADGMVGTEMFLLNLDTHELLAKWVDDIADSRDELGVPSVIAPHGGWTFDWNPAPPWHAAYVFIPWWLYRYGGDTRVLREHFDGIARYLDAEFARADAGIATTTLGDWVAPETPPTGGNPPEDPRVSATIYLYAMLDTAARIARTIGRDGRVFDERALLVRDAFLTRFFDAENSIVRGVGDLGFRQSHNVLALAHGILPEASRHGVADRIAADVRERDDHLNTGVLATKYLLPVLTAHGHVDTAVALARQRSYPSWGHWADRGATTLWEHWHEDARSHGHYFLGTIDDWLYGSVAGITVVDATNIRIAPAATSLVAGATAHITTPHGRVAVSWTAADGVGALDLVTPVGVSTEVVLPGRPAVAVGSGRHLFTFETRTLVTE